VSVNNDLLNKQHIIFPLQLGVLFLPV